MRQGFLIELVLALVLVFGGYVVYVSISNDLYGWWTLAGAAFIITPVMLWTL
jgi:hypothetical protein